MAICQRCKKSLGFREKRFVVAGLVYCLPCMTCSSCRSPADGSPRVVYADQVLCGKCNQSRLQPIKEKMIDQVLQLSLPNPLGTRFLMDSGEIVKTHYTAIRMFKVGPMDFKSEGTFMITNRRIIYLQTRFSPVTVTQVTDQSFEYPLPSVSGATLSTKARNCLLINFGKYEVELFLYGTTGYNFPTDVTLAALLKLREKRIEEIKRFNEKEKVQVVMDFSWLRDYMDKGGVILRTYKCPGCGAAVDIPQAGKSAKCNFCGASFFAEDVFKKVKDLIG